MDQYWTPEEKARSEHRLTYSFVGTPNTVREALDAFVERTGIDELMVVANVFDHAARGAVVRAAASAPRAGR